MTDISPAAQAVLTAFDRHPLRAEHISEDLVPALAAALRAAADQMSAHQSKKFLCSIADCLKLNAIAAELEAQ